MGRGGSKNKNKKRKNRRAVHVFAIHVKARKTRKSARMIWWSKKDHGKEYMGSKGRDLRHECTQALEKARKQTGSKRKRQNKCAQICQPKATNWEENGATKFVKKTEKTHQQMQKENGTQKYNKQKLPQLRNGRQDGRKNTKDEQVSSPKILQQTKTENQHNLAK